MADVDFLRSSARANLDVAIVPVRRVPDGGQVGDERRGIDPADYFRNALVGASKAGVSRHRRGSVHVGLLIRRISNFDSSWLPHQQVSLSVGELRCAWNRRVEHMKGRLETVRCPMETLPRDACIFRCVMIRNDTVETSAACP